MKNNVAANSGEFDFEIRTPDGRPNIKLLSQCLCGLLLMARDGKAESTETIFEILQIYREAFSDSQDPLCIVAALRLCKAITVPPPMWLCNEIDVLICGTISARRWRQAHSHHMDNGIAWSVYRERASPSEGLFGDVYQRVEEVLRSIGFKKDADTARKARQRFEKTRKKYPNRDVWEITDIFLGEYRDLTEGDHASSDDGLLEYSIDYLAWMGGGAGGNEV